MHVEPIGWQRWTGNTLKGGTGLGGWKKQNDKFGNIAMIIRHGWLENHDKPTRIKAAGLEEALRFVLRDEFAF